MPKKINKMKLSTLLLKLSWKYYIIQTIFDYFFNKVSIQESPNFTLKVESVLHLTKKSFITNKLYYLQQEIYKESNDIFF
jgi:hypothetical protein